MPPKCSFEGCPNVGTMAPRLVLIFEDAYQVWEVPVVVDLQVCDVCRPRLEKEKILSSELIAHIQQMRPGALHVRTDLEWIPFTHPEYVALQRSRPN